MCNDKNAYLLNDLLNDAIYHRNMIKVQYLQTPKVLEDILSKI